MALPYQKERGPETKKPETPTKRERFKSLDVSQRDYSYKELAWGDIYCPSRSPAHIVQPTVKDEVINGLITLPT